MAGKLRFLDNREDEQTRGITMKASGISLLYGPLLVNLMDSPGHVDFSSEVTSALLLSDIALLLVDVVEGVCSQTQVLLRQAITHGQTVILVLNKMDRWGTEFFLFNTLILRLIVNLTSIRLCVELKMIASEAYTHIVRLLEAVNSCVSQVCNSMSSVSAYIQFFFFVSNFLSDELQLGFLKGSVSPHVHQPRTGTNPRPAYEMALAFWQ
ncbi:hypothetical protein Y032_0013g1935 [Ancylostoma ceylanicum]|uniref:Tr-type G domain-containing protein n=1 Tax=Ancylostoma ceylanicum TaxID=53326 RepID=A0A016VCQ8_9BILA|nr:hypothetical protein Y032_0013g1935 [Ancylostoma ceylanicum]